jgi:hypothetical protein
MNGSVGRSKACPAPGREIEVFSVYGQALPGRAREKFQIPTTNIQRKVMREA